MTVIIAWDVPTPLGVFTVGLPVTVLQRARYRVKVCMDPPGLHLTGRCHSVYLPPDAVREEDHADSTGEQAPVSAGLAGYQSRRQDRSWMAV